MALSIRAKLVLLAGVPVLGTLFLAQRVLSGAQEQSRKADALGSVESLSVLSSRMTRVMKDLQRERAATALTTARRDGTTDGADAEGRARLTAAFEQTDRDVALLDEFLNERTLSRLPPRLARGLAEADDQLGSRGAFRKRLATSPPKLLEQLEWYERATRAFVRATAALTELSDDGHFVRLLSSFTALLELDERRSEQHALLAHAFVRHEFPPGTYKRLVTLVSEEHTFLDVFQTVASVDLRAALDALDKEPSVLEIDKLRQAALESTEEELPGDAERWFELTEQEFAAIERLEAGVDAQLRATTLAKLERSRREVTLGLGSAGSVVLLSLIFAGLIAHNLTKRIERLRAASERLARGDLSARVPMGVSDELGEAGAAFNAMAEEIDKTRTALATRARMARDLEIAAKIQQSMLPPRPSHPALAFASRLEPAEEVGGDFYDILTDPTTGALWVTIGDVSGHGVSAGLVMLMTQVAFAAHFLQDASSPSEFVFEKVNALLFDTLQNRLSSDLFVSAQLFVHEKDGRFSCIGGHTFPIVYRAKTKSCEIVEAEGPWLGCGLTLPPLGRTNIDLEVGDVLCLYTDGLIEARGTNGELFGEKRLRELLASSLAKDPLPEVIDAVFAGVDTFSGSSAREDDWALLLIQRRAITA